MGPVFALNDIRDRLSVNTVYGGEFSVGNTAPGILLAYFQNLRFSDFCFAITVFLASLTFHIRHVVVMGSQKQVCRINATRVIAMMTAEHTLGDSAIVQFVAVAMREFHLVTNVQHPVTSRKLASRPFPTFIGSVLVDVLPKTIYCRTAAIVSMYKACWLPHDATIAFVGYCGEWRRLTASAFAEFNRRVLRGIIEGHGDLHSRCVKPWDALTSPGQLIAYLHYTPFRQFKLVNGGAYGS